MTVLRVLTLGTLFAAFGCKTIPHTFHRGNNAEMFGQGSGEFTLKKSAQRPKGLKLAYKSCRKPPTVIGSEMIQKINNWSTTSGHLIGRAAFFVTQHHERVTTLEKVRYVCEDAEPQRAYILVSENGDDSPLCEPVPAGFAPGKERIQNVRHEQLAADDCVDEEGWLRYKQGRQKLHIFIGDDGLALCQKIEEQFVQAEVPTKSANLWLKKNLTCGNAGNPVAFVPKGSEALKLKSVKCQGLGGTWVHNRCEISIEDASEDVGQAK